MGIERKRKRECRKTHLTIKKPSRRHRSYVNGKINVLSLNQRSHVESHPAGTACSARFTNVFKDGFVSPLHLTPLYTQQTIVKVCIMCNNRHQHRGCVQPRRSDSKGQKIWETKPKERHSMYSSLQLRLPHAKRIR